MNKTEFLKQLEVGLKKHNIHDIEEIINDYHEHFEAQKEQNKTEEDIAKSLGDLNSIIEDYASFSSKHKRAWFDLVAINMLAVPMLIIHYGLLIVLIASTLAFWSVAVYYFIGMDSLSFLPAIPFGVHYLYILTSLIAAFLFFGLSVNDGYILKSMTKQYVVKQTIRIGNPHIPVIYRRLTKRSFYVFIGLFIVTYVISALVAKDFQYWHVWGWFN